MKAQTAYHMEQYFRDQLFKYNTAATEAEYNSPEHIEAEDKVTYFIKRIANLYNGTVTIDKEV